jgi:hypothetical protein
LHAEFFSRETTDPLAPTRLEVIDRATDAALQRLLDAGLIAKADRAARPLDPEEAADSAVALTTEEGERLKGLLDQAARRLKMIRVLAAGGLEEEARAAAGDAVLVTARALAVRHRLPEPGELSGALQPPLRFHWSEGGARVREFLEAKAGPITPLMECLEQALAPRESGVPHSP